MELKSQTHGDAMLVIVDADRIDAAIAVQFKDAMREAADGGPDRVVLDMSNVSFLDSSGLGAVVGAMKALAPSRKLELAGLTPTVGKVFHLTRMDTVFTIHPNAGTAIDGLVDAT